ncbi:MAG: hypothetical protein JXX14_05575 [Deltaproteobacteria bacterium]|nr:hypothetical protein [Deltaproteobacteria bacterium]
MKIRGKQVSLFTTLAILSLFAVSCDDSKDYQHLRCVEKEYENPENAEGLEPSQLWNLFQYDPFTILETAIGTWSGTYSDDNGSFDWELTHTSNPLGRSLRAYVPAGYLNEESCSDADFETCAQEGCTVDGMNANFSIVNSSYPEIKAGFQYQGISGVSISGYKVEAAPNPDTEALDGIPLTVFELVDDQIFFGIWFLDSKNVFTKIIPNNER